MEKDFGIERDSNGMELIRENVEGLKLSFVEGLCMAHPTDPTRPRDIDWYVTNILQPAIDSGEISDGLDGPYDDRKIRFHSATINRGILKISLGISHYNEFLETFKRSEDENMTLQQRGKEDFNDAHAYFPRNPGVASIIITADGSLFLGKKLNDGSLAAVAGHIGYTRDVKRIDLINELEREMEEEFGVKSRDVTSMVFVGVYCDPIHRDLDFSYLVFSSLPDEYFGSGAWRVRATTIEHGNLVRLATYQEVKMLLSACTVPRNDKKWKLTYPTRGILQSIKPDEMK